MSSMPLWMPLWMSLWVATISSTELGAGGDRGVTVVIGREVPDAHCEEILDKLQVQGGRIKQYFTLDYMS